jgi:hypothetical protein
MTARKKCSCHKQATLQIYTKILPRKPKAKNLKTSSTLPMTLMESVAEGNIISTDTAPNHITKVVKNRRRSAQEPRANRWSPLAESLIIIKQLQDTAECNRASLKSISRAADQDWELQCVGRSTLSDEPLTSNMAAGRHKKTRARLRTHQPKVLYIPLAAFIYFYLCTLKYICTRDAALEQNEYIKTHF